MDPTDAADLIERLDPQTLRDRIAELDRRRRALAILLRAAVARDRVRTVRERGAAPEVSGAR